MSAEPLKTSSSTSSGTTPFLKWAGGKRHRVADVVARVPTTFWSDPSRLYFEPFLGSGAVYFGCEGFWGRRAHLSDGNGDLVKTYLAVRDDVERLIGLLSTMPNTEREFYLTREGFNRRRRIWSARHRRSTRQGNDPKIELSLLAADFIYLNKTCFNGLYRTNRSGDFNVPFGRYESPAVCDKETLRAASAALVGATIQPFDVARLGQALLHAAHPSKGDVVYFDPPYDPTSSTSDFSAYTRRPFGLPEHQALRDVVVGLVARGTRVILSSAATSFAFALYKDTGLHIDEVSARRSIAAKSSTRGVVKEFLIWG